MIDLLPHQQQAVEMMVGQRRVGVFLEMGLGKTRCAIEAVQRVEAKRILVLAPNSLLESWQGEVAKWSNGAEPEVRLLRGDMPDRVEALNRPVTTQTWAIVNYDAIWTLANPLRAWAPDVIVADESTWIKNPTAKRSKAAYLIAEEVPSRWALTGNPLPNSELDAYGQFRFIDKTILGFDTWTAFRREFGIEVGNGRVRFWIANKRKAEKLSALIAPHYIRVKRADCLKLPESVRQRRMVDLGADQARVYHSVRRQFHAQVSASATITAPSVLARLRRLLQITGGFCPTDMTVDADPLDDRPMVTWAPNPKIGELLAVVEEMPQAAQFLVWAIHKREIVAISEALTHAKVPNATLYGATVPTMRAANIAAFKSGAVRCMVANPQVAAYGLNLPEATYHVFYSSDWSLDHRDQAEARSQRIGQMAVVTYVDILARGTIDLDIQDALAGKRELDGLIKSRTPKEVAEALFGERGGESA